MKKELIILIAAVLVLAAIAVIIGITAMSPNLWGRSTDAERNSENSPGPGMMGPGMMGPGMMGSGIMGSGMMAVFTADARPIAESDARSRALAYANRYYPGAGIGDFMEFSLNYYVELKDASNRSIAEILVDRYTGGVSPEPGPNMMWNTRSGVRGTTTAVAYDLTAARSLAEKFLPGYLPEATIQESMSYPGYYTFDFGRGRIEGMLSVNAYTGSIWVHTWHGQYIGGD